LAIAASAGAIDIALSDGPIEEACAFAHVKPTTVKDWLRMIRQGGIVEVLHAWETSKRPRMLDADAMELGNWPRRRRTRV
jgi:hypothetical protein